MSSLSDLKAKLEGNAASRAKFLADLLSLLEKHGVDVNDPVVLKSLDLNLDLSDGPRFIKGLSASTNVITVAA